MTSSHSNNMKQLVNLKVSYDTLYKGEYELVKLREYIGEYIEKFIDKPRRDIYQVNLIISRKPRRKEKIETIHKNPDFDEILSKHDFNNVCKGIAEILKIPENRNFLNISGYSASDDENISAQIDEFIEQVTGEPQP